MGSWEGGEQGAACGWEVARQDLGLKAVGGCRDAQGSQESWWLDTSVSSHHWVFPALNSWETGGKWANGEETGEGCTESLK